MNDVAIDTVRASRDGHHALALPSHTDSRLAGWNLRFRFRLERHGRALDEKFQRKFWFQLFAP